MTTMADGSWRKWRDDDDVDVDYDGKINKAIYFGYDVGYLISFLNAKSP